MLVPPDDPGALADAVNGLLSDPDRRLRLARAAAAAAAGPYSWDEAARRTLELYRGLVSRRGPPLRHNRRRRDRAGDRLLGLGRPGAVRPCRLLPAALGGQPGPPAVRGGGRSGVATVSVGDRRRLRRGRGDRRPRRQPARARLPSRAARGDRRLRRLPRRYGASGRARPAPTSCSSSRAAARSAPRTRRCSAPRPRSWRSRTPTCAGRTERSRGWWRRSPIPGWATCAATSRSSTTAAPTRRVSTGAMRWRCGRWSLG